MDPTAKFARYQTEHLILLVGGNPLPNAVAVRLLWPFDRGKVYLVHTGEHGSGSVATHLRSWLDPDGTRPDQVILRETDESSPIQIRATVESILHELDGCRVGLHYTGGTKAMSTHAYRAVERWLAGGQGRRSAVFSYLNPRDLEMVFTGIDPATPDQEVTEMVGQAFEPQPKDLLALHGWESLSYNDRPELHPIAHALVTLAVTKPTLWADWKRGAVVGPQPQPQPLQYLENNYKRFGSGWSQQRIRVDKGKKAADYPRLEDHCLALPGNPDLANVCCALQSSLGWGAGPMPLGKLAAAAGMQPGALLEWLDGKWLEHAVLHALQSLTGTVSGLRDCIQSLEIEKPIGGKGPFCEIDVAAMVGYQLFILSCGTGNPKELKLKLFEARTRACQLGGDEAAVALVCTLADKERDDLARNVRSLMGSQARVAVFGRKDLCDLQASLRQWIENGGIPQP